MRRHWRGAHRGSEAATFRGALDEPGTALVTRGPVLFYGWALAGSDSPAAVDLVVNDHRRISMQIGVDRPDVPLYLGEPDTTGACGWSGVVDLVPEPAGDLRVQVVASDAFERSQVIADRLFTLSGDAFTGRIEVPANGAELEGDLLVVTGWASSVDGVASIDIELDGNVLGQARLGLPRPDVRAHAPDLYGPLCGFEFRGAVQNVSNGDQHQLSVSVVDNVGYRAVLGELQLSVTDAPVLPEDQLVADLLRARTAAAIERSAAVSCPRHRDLLVFTHSLLLGGGELYLLDLLSGMQPTLDRCTVVSPLDGLLRSKLEQLGIDVVISGPRSKHDIASYEGAVRELALSIRASGCSSVLLNTISEWMSADAAQRVGIPTIWAIHESFELADWLDLNSAGPTVPPFVRDRLECALRNASKVVFESAATREMYVGFGVPNSSALTVPYGIDIDAIDAYRSTFDREDARRQLELPADATVLLCMGVFQDRKSQAWLVQAFAQVARAHPDAVLVLVGDHPSPYSSTVHEVIEATDLGLRVRTVPITSDTWQWYAIADLLVSASDVESLPRSILEAMAFGCPVLASAVYGIPELITDGTTGWLMRARDTAALTAGLHRVLGLDAAERASVATAARSLVGRSHRPEAWVSTYLRLIDELEARG